MLLGLPALLLLFRASVQVLKRIHTAQRASHIHANTPHL